MNPVVAAIVLVICDVAVIWRELSRFCLYVATFVNLLMSSRDMRLMGRNEMVL